MTTENSNAAPIVIVLDTPYTTGDLAPDVQYPHVYITTFYVNGPALNMTLTYEFGTFTAGGWQGAPNVPTQNLTFNAAELYPFFGRTPNSVETPLWDQVEQGLYEQIQEKNGRTAGKVMSLRAGTSA